MLPGGALFSYIAVNAESGWADRVHSHSGQLDGYHERAPVHVQAEGGVAGANLQVEGVELLRVLLVREEILAGLSGTVDENHRFGHFP